MDITRAEREELNALSLEIFGVKSKWQKLVNKGVSVLATRTATETVPGENGQPDTTKEVQIPLLSGGAQYKTQKYYTVEDVRKLLLDLKAQKEAYEKAERQRALQQKVQEEAGTKPIG